MSEPKRSENRLKTGESMSTSIAAKEAFDCLNAGMRKEFRGWGDTRTAARDRAAKEAGVTPAQGTRLWKNWQTMASVDGDVYRLLLRKYGHLCSWIENAAAAMEQEARGPGDKNEARESRNSMGAGMDRTP
ncbi:hypothetical protein [Mesorhizobium caraganae]|uniref:hypothetical protein n=1 Tax=Mesorhizobium caraganae TaxID=483206 RepID=UPI00177E7B8C|nr:hypothetical protein [Mesorhizobium caraganae]